MKRFVKKTLAFVLVAVMLLGMVPTVFAAGTQGQSVTNGYYVLQNGNATNEWKKGDLPSNYQTLPSGIVSINKTATPTGTVNQYNITLSVVTQSVVYPSAVTLCLDTSSSMMEPMTGDKPIVSSVNGKIDLSGLDTSKPEGYYTISGGSFFKSYGAMRYNNGNWEVYTEKTFFVFFIPVTQTSWETVDKTASYSVYKTRKGVMIDAVESFVNSYKGYAPEGLISIVTFGKTQNGKSSDAQLYLDWTASKDAVINAVEKIDCGLETSGYGTPMAEGVKLISTQMNKSAVAGVEVANRFAILFGDGEPDSTSSTQTAATALKSSGKIGTLFTVFSGDPSASSAIKYMKQYASADKYALNASSSPASMVAAFNSIADTILSEIASSLTVTDPMADYVTVIAKPSNFVQKSGDVYTWDLSSSNPSVSGTKKTYTLTYTIKVDADSIYFDDIQYHPANEPTYITFRNNNYYFPVPGVTGQKTLHTVTFLNWDGSVLSTKQYKHGTPVANISIPTATKAKDVEYTYIFAGWDTPVVDVNGDATYKATFTTTNNKYTVTWKNEDGSVLKTEQLLAGAQPSYAGTPTKASDNKYDYVFNGWTPAVTKVTGNVTYTATYKAVEKAPNMYTITWKNEDGTVLKVDKVQENKVPNYQGATPTKAPDDEYDYKFDGWTPEVSKATKDVTYTAKFNAVKREVTRYTVIWKNEDGTILKEEKLAVGTQPAYEGTPKKASDDENDYVFAGWTPEVKAVTGDVVYTATYKAEKIQKEVTKYTVTWKNEDGTTLLEEKLEEGTFPKYEGTPTKASDDENDYVFDGWTPELGKVGADVVYTAKYKAVKREVARYTVTWKNYDGTTLKEELLPSGTQPSYVGTPTKAADNENYYVFAGWSPAIAPLKGDVTYTATFTAVKKNVEKEEEKTHVITWKNADGTTLKEEIYVEGSIPQYDGTPEMASDDAFDYEFSGWSPVITEANADVTYVAQYTATERIEEEETPLVGGWGLLNLLCVVATAVIAAFMFSSKKKDEKDADKNAKQTKKEDKNEKKAKNFKLASVAVAIISMIVFIITEDISAPMVITDKYTILMAIIGLVQAGLAFVSNKKENGDNNDKNQPKKAEPVEA